MKKNNKNLDKDFILPLSSIVDPDTVRIVQEGDQNGQGVPENGANVARRAENVTQ